jgi:hypothetical protein
MRSIASWKRIAGSCLSSAQATASFLERYRHKKYIYLALIQAALAEEVRTGKVVYHGNAGHLLLPGGTPVLRTRIIAPLEFRVTMTSWMP